jgi:hypothetical protein
MRTAFVTISALTAFAIATPAAAFERESGGEKKSLALYALEPHTPAPRRAGRTIAEFDVGDQAVTVAAYGRRARARAMGNADDVRHARAMGKVFDGAPQPALLTFEVSLKF